MSDVIINRTTAPTPKMTCLTLHRTPPRAEPWPQGNEWWCSGSVAAAATGGDRSGARHIPHVLSDRMLHGAWCVCVCVCVCVLRSAWRGAAYRIARALSEALLLWRPLGDLRRLVVQRLWLRRELDRIDKLAREETFPYSGKQRNKPQTNEQTNKTREPACAGRNGSISGRKSKGSTQACANRGGHAADNQITSVRLTEAGRRKVIHTASARRTACPHAVPGGSP